MIMSYLINIGFMREVGENLKIKESHQQYIFEVVVLLVQDGSRCESLRTIKYIQSMLMMPSL